MFEPNWKKEAITKTGIERKGKNILTSMHLLCILVYFDESISEDLGFHILSTSNLKHVVTVKP